VLAVWRRKDEVIWTDEEDEVILKLFIKCKDNDEIVRTLKFKARVRSIL
jgi:hypothetical protein